MFQQPSAGSDFKAKDHVGHLLLIYPRDVREGIVTKNGTADAVNVDLVVLTDQAGPRLEMQVLLFQKPLVSSLRGNIGKDPVLARLGRGNPQPGQEPDRAPYLLNPFDEQDAAFATQYLQSVGGNPWGAAPNFQAPAAVPAPIPAAPLPAAVPQAVPAAYPPATPAAYPPAYPAAYPAPAPAPVPAAYPAPQAAPVPQQQYAAPAAPAAPAPAQHMVQLPNGQFGTPEQAAAMQALGMHGMPPAAPAHQ